MSRTMQDAPFEYEQMRFGALDASFFDSDSDGSDVVDTAEPAQPDARAAQSSSSKARPWGFDQMFGASAAEIMSLGIDRNVEFDESGRPKKRTKRLGDGVRRTKKLDEKLVRLMGEANSDYLQGKLEAAVEILLEVIKLAPEHQPAFKTLGMIYEESGDRQKALDIYMIAADLNSRDAEQWQHLSQMANEIGNRDQELHCLNKLIRLLPDNSDVLFKRAMLYKDIGNWRKCIDGLSTLLYKKPYDAVIIKELATAYHHHKKPVKAIALLESYIDHAQSQREKRAAINPDLPAAVAAAIRQADDALLDAEPLSLDVVNVLCELYFSMRQYDNIISLLEMVGVWWEEDFHSQRISSAALPLELVVHRGLALLHHAALSDDTVPESTINVARSAFELLLLKKPSEYSDLYLKVCDAYLDAGCIDLAEQSLNAFTRATSVEHSVSNDAPCVLQRRGHVAARRGDWSRAAELYDRALNTNESFASAIAALTLTDAQMTELRLSASSAFRRIGEEPRSVQLFGDAPVQPPPVEAPGRRSTPAPRSTSKAESSASATTDPEQNVDALIPVAARLLIRHEAGEHKAFVACALPLLLRCLPTPPRCGHAPPDSFLPFTAETLAASSTAAAAAAPSVAAMFSQPTLTLEPVAVGQLVEYHPLPALPPKAQVEQRAIALSRECKSVIRRVLVRFHEQERSVAAPAAEPASTESSSQAYARLRLSRHAAAQAVNSASLTDRNAAVFDFALRCVRSLVQLRHWVEATFLTRELLLWDEARMNHSLFVQALLLGVEVGYAAELVEPDLMLAYECVRQLLHLNPKSDAVVDVFNRVVCQARLHKRVARILDRLIERESQATALRVLSGNIYLQNRQFNLAAQTYAAALQQRPDDALLHLLLGLCFLETSAQRTGEERDRVHLIVLQAFGFLDQYARLSQQIGDTARVVAEYNLARAYHAIGMNHLAVIAYERVLGAGAAGESVRVCAAHNLAKIYAESDNIELARRVLYTFNTVE